MRIKNRYCFGHSRTIPLSGRNIEQRAKTMKLWAELFVELRMPKIFNLRRDPFERADENANGYWNWFLEHVFVIYPMQALAAE